MNRLPQRGSLIALIAAGALVLQPRATQAQHIYAEATRVKLQAPTHLTLGTTTIRQVMASLTAQTGVPCEAAEYLREHRLTAQMDGMSGLDVLNTLVELYGWRWYETEDNRIVLTRQKPKPLQSVADIPPAFIAALPNDFFHFLGGDERPLTAGEASRLTLAQQAKLSETNYGFNRGEQFQMYKRTDDYRQTHFDWLEPALIRGKSLPFARLTLLQQQTIISKMMMESLCQSNDVMGRRTLMNIMDPYELDLSKAEITLRKEGLMLIGTTKAANGKEVRFGQTVPLNELDRLFPLMP